MEHDGANRLAVELELLQAMYPEAMSFSLKAREVKYVHAPLTSGKSAAAGTLLLRLPDFYPDEGVPEVLLASGAQKEDLRSPTMEAIANLGLPPGEEVLDAIILSFQDLLSSRTSRLGGAGEHRTGTLPDRRQSGEEEFDDQHFRTVVIWLHHLLNTNKRKLALNPMIIDHRINGMTKPGYPGVLVFSGPKSSVDAHVSELRNQRWQAFQVRYDSEDDAEVGNRNWSFKHETGICEVESMSDLTQGILSAGQREAFLNAIGVR
ncbi:hypothetical protein SLS62_002243 [Diatrype stigma]|uniref:RWD domain-containing protein n=1 Tax=Diatrype stigma TaxID=117547 RepID=A0AAN9UUA2_9PEZI